MANISPEPSRFIIVPQRKPPSRAWWLLWLLLWALSLLGMYWWASGGRGAADTATASSGSILGSSGGEDLKQQLATLRRSDQISRAANTELQTTLAEREEEISGLRADVAFYERLVGATGQRKGLKVHEATFRQEEGGGWKYIVTLTQNLNRGVISGGEMRFSVEGVKDGKLSTIGWNQLLQKPSAGGQKYSFRYFQQLEGNVMLPQGFTPQRVNVSLRGGGQSVDQKFDWAAK
jgi:hypothetical protein